MSHAAATKPQPHAALNHEQRLAKARLAANDPEIIWSPLPGSQSLAISSPCHHTLYEGARGPGKTVTQLMRFLRHVGKGYGKYWRGVIFDKEFDNLGGLVAESKKWFGKFGDGADWSSSASLYKWTWPTGEELLFRHVKKLEDYEGFHGHEFPFIGWNELSKYATGELYDKFMSVNRSTFDPERDTPTDPKTGEYLTPNRQPLPPIPLEVFSTTNPSGPGHNWIKRRFINVAPRGTIVRKRVEIFNPQTQANDVVEKTQVAIFGSYRENKYLPPEYIAELESITDQNLRKAWLYGDWDVTVGGALDDIWDSKVHILPRFAIPSSWRIDRSFDWGSSHPFSVGWWAEANGEEAQIIVGDQIYTFCPPAGSLIQFFEWYGTKEIGTNKGLKISATDIAQGIIDREIALMANGWIETQPYPGPADNQIRDVREIDVDTIESKMAKKGVKWIESDKSPGSRRNGLQLIRDRLEAAIKREGPALYFMQNCAASIEILPSLPRDEKTLDDVDTSVEDHPYDMVRYRVLKGNEKKAAKLNVEWST